MWGRLARKLVAAPKPDRPTRGRLTVSGTGFHAPSHAYACRLFWPWNISSRVRSACTVLGLHAAGCGARFLNITFYID
jgi:hypothetical protein